MKMIELKFTQMVNGTTRNANDGPVWVDEAEYNRLVKQEKTATCITKNYSPEQLANLAPRSAVE